MTFFKCPLADLTAASYSDCVPKNVEPLSLYSSSHLPRLAVNLVNALVVNDDTTSKCTALVRMHINTAVYPFEYENGDTLPVLAFRTKGP